MRAPWRANSRTMARPNPAVAPVITTTSPVPESCLLWLLLMLNSVSPFEHLREMQRLAPGALFNLSAATEAVGDDQAVRRGFTHCRQQRTLADRDRDIVV